MKQRTSIHMGVGTSSMMMIFVVLCLTTLGILSFVSAKADLTLTEKVKESTTSYYNGEYKVEKTLSKIDEILLYASRESNGNQQVYEEIARELLSDEEDIFLEGSLVFFKIPISSTMEIQVEARISNINEINERMKVIRNQLVNIREWDTDNSLELWDGNGE